uniref:Uncharacterized protein n=1 Tax=Panagrolaimus sp. ES5 TaxID=591445 RepID=A0AC34GME2_9BILA
MDIRGKRDTSKKKILFDIAEIKDVMINLYRDVDPKKKKDRPQIVGYVNINTNQILSRHPVER